MSKIEEFQQRVAGAIGSRQDSGAEDLESNAHYVIDSSTGRIVDGPFERLREIPLRFMGYDGAHKVRTGAELQSQESEMHEYLFDVKLDAAIRFKAPSEAAARDSLRSELECASANLGEILGQTIVCEVSMNGEPSVAEIDGDPFDESVKRVPLISVVAAEKALAAHGDVLGIEGDAKTQVSHVVASLHEYCAANGVDFDVEVADVKRNIASGEIESPLWRARQEDEKRHSARPRM